MFNKIISTFLNFIQIPQEYEDLAKLDKSHSWYLSDSIEEFICSSANSKTSILEVDIKNAFFTICNIIFDKESKFLEELNKLSDKKQRNIFIATQLKNTPYLKQLNMLCKVIILGILFETENIHILELKKDGAVIVCAPESAMRIENINEEPVGRFSEFIINQGVKFRITKYYKYIRVNKTSWYWQSNNDLIIKGLYKYTPKKLYEYMIKILNEEKLDVQKILKIYSSKYFQIIVINNLDKILNEYYLCSNNKYLVDGKYCNDFKDINPREYLKTFLFPVILSTKGVKL